jgi:hypothetical protein
MQGALSLLALVFVLAHGAQDVAPEADETVPSSGTLVLEAQGNGFQIYGCTAQGSAYTWTLTAPEATLIDPAGDEIGTHSAGPTWTFKDGSSITGKVTQKKASPEEGSIPWLLLAATVTPGHPGQADTISFVRRYNTHGGAAPATGCDADNAGKTRRVPYTATYAFYSSHQ